MRVLWNLNQRFALNVVTYFLVLINIYCVIPGTTTKAIWSRIWSELET